MSKQLTILLALLAVLLVACIDVARPFLTNDILRFGYVTAILFSATGSLLFLHWWMGEQLCGDCGGAMHYEKLENYVYWHKHTTAYQLPFTITSLCCDKCQNNIINKNDHNLILAYILGHQNGKLDKKV
jgi:hypothetical protein